MEGIRALILTGYGLNCDYETDFSLKLAGAESQRMHINELIESEKAGQNQILNRFHILVFGGGFAWADEHGAGVILATKIKYNLGEQLERFIEQGKLIIGICNGFQSIVNLGLLPGFDRNYHDRRIALISNDTNNYIDAWVNLQVNPDSPCVFTKGINQIELPVRHGEGKFFTSDEDMHHLFGNHQVVMKYADVDGEDADGEWPLNPNGSLRDIAGICDPTGRIFGLMPHPEAFNHITNHPDWTRQKAAALREGKTIDTEEGDGIKIFRNAVDYVRQAILDGRISD